MLCYYQLSQEPVKEEEASRDGGGVSTPVNVFNEKSRGINKGEQLMFENNNNNNSTEKHYLS